MAPESVAFFKQEKENRDESYHISFVKPTNTLFSRVLVNITNTDDGNTTELSYQHNGNI